MILNIEFLSTDVNKYAELQLLCKTGDSKFILYRSILILQERNFKMNKRVWLKAGVLYYPPRDCV